MHWRIMLSRKQRVSTAAQKPAKWRRKSRPPAVSRIGRRQWMGCPAVPWTSFAPQVAEFHHD